MTIYRLHRTGDPEARTYWASAGSEREARVRIFRALQYDRLCPDPEAVLGGAYDCTVHRSAVTRCDGR